MRLSRKTLSTPRLRHVAALELLSVRASGYRYLNAYSRRAMYLRASKCAADRAREAWQAGMKAHVVEMDAVAAALLDAAANAPVFCPRWS